MIPARQPTTRELSGLVRDIGEARIALEETTSGDPATRSLEGAGSGPGSLATTVLPWGLLALVLLFVAITQWGGNGTGAVQEPIAFSIHTNGWNLPVNFVDNPILDVSRDGQQFVWMAGAGNSTQLFVRSLDDSEVKAIPGTEGAISPFFSPDGEWIGFFAGGKLKKVASRGANVQDITEVEGLTRGAWWGENETIVFSPNYQSGLWEVQASGGGVPQMLTEVDEAAGERTHRFPQVLPGGDAILLTVGFVDAPSAYDDAHIAVYSRRDGKMKTLIQGGHMGRYVFSGHLLYMRSGALLPLPFDPEELEVTGQPSLISESIGREPSSGAGYFAISDSGTLLYRPVESGESDIRIVLADRQGMVTRLSFPGGSFTTPSFSPDGRQIAYGTGVGGRGDVFVGDLESGVATRLTFQGPGGSPLWSSDGSRIYHSSTRPGQEGGIFPRTWEGSTPEAVVFVGDQVTVLSSISSDDRLLAITTYSPTVHIKLLEFEEGGAGSRSGHSGLGKAINGEPPSPRTNAGSPTPLTKPGGMRFT